MDRSEYLRDYRQKMRGRVKRANLTFSVSEYRAFEKAAAAAGEKPSSHIKALALQALKREVLFPPEVENELRELSHLIRNVANNVNQMARHSHHIAHVLDENEPLALQALKREVLFPPEIENELAQLSHLIRNVANNVNQMARHSHHIAHVLDENEPLAELVRLENLLKEAIKKMAKEGE